MAEIPSFPMVGPQDDAEELLVLMLEDMAKVTGIPFGEIMASEFEEARRTTEEILVEERVEETKPEFVTTEIGEEEFEAAEEIFDLENEYGSDSGDYLDGLVEDLDVNPGDEDAYTEEDV